MPSSHQNPKRVLYIQKPYGGGSSISLLELVKGLDKKRFVPIVLFFQDNEFRCRYEKAGIEVICIKGINLRPNRVNGTTNIFFLKSIKELFVNTLPLIVYLFLVIKKHNIDLVHQNLGFDKAAMIVSILTNRPQVCHFRIFSGISKMTKFLSRFVDAVIYNSESVSEHYLKHHKALGSKHVIYNPIANNTFNKIESRKQLKNEWPISDDDIIISNVGRITPWKGQLYFLQALEQVVQNVQNIKILIVGSPGITQKDCDYLRELEEYTESNPPLRKKVIFTGHRNDIERIMSASNLVVHSAIEPEPFGRVIAESMFAGTPVIASQAGGVTEIIEHRVTGLLVNPKNTTELCNAMLELINSDELTSSISRSAKQYVCRQFSIENHIEKIQELYVKIFRHREQRIPISSVDEQVH